MAQSEKSSVVINLYTEDVSKKLQTFLENEIRNEGIDEDVSISLNTCEKLEVYKRIKTFLARLEEDAESELFNEEVAERLKTFLEKDAGSKGVKDDIYRRIKTFLEEDAKSETEYDNVYEELKTFLEVDASNGANENMGFSVNPNDVDLDKSDYENLVEKIKKAKHTISVVTKKSVDNFFKDEEHYQVWLRALHKALDDDNVLSHIIFCVDVDVVKVTWYLRQFNPCIKYSSENDDWKKELQDVLKLEKKSVKTLKHVNAGEALAWSHYTGYVSFLPNVDASGNPKDESVWEDKEGRPVINELVMLVPKDCHCPGQINENEKHVDNSSIKGPFDSKRFSFHRAGKERKLNADLYEVEGIEKLVPIACTPSIDTLRFLKDDKNLDDKWLKDQRDRFVAVLKQRIEADEYLRRKVIFIDEYDSSMSMSDLAEVIRGRIKSACEQMEENQKGPSAVKKKEKSLSVYIHSTNEEDGKLAEKIADAIEGKMPNINIVGKSTRIMGKLPHEEVDLKIKQATQCIFLLTEKSKYGQDPNQGQVKENVSAKNEACACMEKVLECDNKRCTILLYTKEAKEVHKDFFSLLAENVVAHIEYGGDGWEEELVNNITERQARPLQSAVNLHNISEGLAFGYLYGYLKIFLPEWLEKMAQSEKVKNVSDVMPKKIVIVMPKSGFAPPSLAKEGTSFRELGYDERRIDKIEKRVACQVRNFSVTEYSLKDDDGNEYFVAAEFLTPLQTLTEMQADIFADMSIKQKREHQKNLRKVMLEIEKSELIPKELDDKFILLEIEDEHIDEKGKYLKKFTDPEKLELYRQEILKTVREELKRERENPEEQVAQRVERMDMK